MARPSNGYVEIDGGRLYYETAGSGDPLVLAHAAFLDSRMFDAQWEEFARHFHVIRYDMRGFGRSGTVSAPVSRRDDLRHLLDHLGVRRAHFVGSSMSGEIVLDLTLEHPELVASLTLVNASPSGFELQGEPPRYIMEMMQAAQQGDIDRTSELQIRIWLDGIYREPDQVDATLREKALTMNRIPVERKTFLISESQPLNPLDPPAAGRLGEVACPTLIVVGSLDHPELLRAAELMAEQIPNAMQVIIDGAAHVPSYEKPDIFNPLLLRFLRAHPLPV